MLSGVSGGGIVAGVGAAGDVAAGGKRWTEKIVASAGISVSLSMRVPPSEKDSCSES